MRELPTRDYKRVLIHDNFKALERFAQSQGYADEARR